MSMTPEQLKQLQLQQHALNNSELQPLTREDIANFQNQPQQAPPDPMDALKEVAFLACDIYTEFAKNQELDVLTKASALSQMSQSIGNIFGILNQPSPEQDLQIKAAELQMKAQEHQLNLEAKQQEMQFKAQESNQKLQQKEIENRMNIIHKQQGHEQSLQQKKEAQKQTPQPKQGNKPVK
jgi:hypothetical protein